MRNYVILPWLLCVFMLNAFSVKNQGYFDVGLGPIKIDDTIINGTTTEYHPGPAINTSVGMSYRNGLGVGVNWGFHYHSVKQAYTDAALVQNDDDAQEFTNYSAGIDFTFKLLPTSDISFYVTGGPCLVINTDQKLLSTTESEPTGSTVETITDGDGNVTQTTTTVTTDTTQAADPFEYHEHMSFGYQVGGGIEYRQDNHKALLIRLNYLTSQIYNSEYDETTTEVTHSRSDRLKGLSGAVTFRYYL